MEKISKIESLQEIIADMTAPNEAKDSHPSVCT
jgi:hypothetical protein